MGSLPVPARRQLHGLEPSLRDAGPGAKVGSESSQGCSFSKHGSRSAGGCNWAPCSPVHPLPSHPQCPKHQGSSSSQQSYLLTPLRQPGCQHRTWRSAERATLTTLGGSLCPGRYLTFSCSVLMISVSRRPPTSSSSTHMFTWFSKVLSRAALLPAILAMAEPLRGQSRAVGSERCGRWHRGAQCTPGHWMGLVKPGQLAPGTAGHRGGRGPRCARRGDAAAGAAGAHQLPEPTTQTFLPPMVRAPKALRSADPAAAISRPPAAGAAPARPRPRLAPGGGTGPPGGTARGKRLPRGQVK